jgi:alpha-mannosidase
MHQQRWTIKKIKQRLALVESLVYRQTRRITPFRYHALADASQPPPVDPDMDDTGWVVIEPHSYWGAWDTNFVMRSHFEVPDEWAGEAVALFLPLGEAGDFSHPEALVYLDGVPYAACDRHHQEIFLHDVYQDGRLHALALHGWTGGAARLGDGYHQSQLMMRPCLLAQIDRPTREFAALARVALEVVERVEESHAAYNPLLNALDSAFRALDTREPFGAAFYDSVPAALDLLREGTAAAGAPLDVTLTAVGHAHIDVAWLWPLAQTRRKAGRTFHTVMRLMEQFPEYHFTQSQPQLYDYVRQDYPELFEAIKARVADGRWEAIGGMWVEADCNISGGESLARQFLLGRSFFRRHFGREAESPVLWLPDVFGYAWNLPQLIKQAGLEYFFTIKIGWNQYNKLPYDTFWWQGLDGTRVLTHFSPVSMPWRSGGDYNAEATPKEILVGWERFAQKEISNHILMSYGYGDGGGGPTREMLENLREMEAFPGLPQARQGKAIDFFRAAEEEAWGSFPVWNGELYLELHRGTYTTQARNKRANRKSEFLLHDAEFAASFAAAAIPDFTYPHADLRRAWELVCLNQFHDIIPGSSIQQVYVDSQAQYAEVRTLGEAAWDGALIALAGAIGTEILVINPTSFAQTGPVCWPEGDESRLPPNTAVQAVEGGLLLQTAEQPPYSIQALGRMAEAPALGKLSVSEDHLENEFLRVELNQNGDIGRIYDKVWQREVMPSGALGNQWLAFEDRPLDWDAWDIDIFYDEKVWTADPADSVTVIETGPLRAALEIKRRILNSMYVQRISLCHNSARLDFETAVDWRERHILLKTAFPVNVLAAAATYEIQWGNVQRPVNRNTSWEWAKFETVGHKWVDLSEGDYGVSLINDCKYGHDVQDAAPNGGVIRLSLLRSPTFPDPQADQGEHHFVYSLLPHSGSWDERTIGQAYALNDPPRVFAVKPGLEAAGAGAGEVSLPVSFINVNRANVVVETVKQAEDGRGLIVRLYESQRQRGTAILSAAYPLRGAWRTNLMEENESELSIDGRSVTLFIKPYEIVTLRLEL